ncbi:MAG TPA: CotH kinase family protein [Prolixibacteraceae bacterium]|nr:CotH kinase family protein [Prolixibacteraceae bacterium]
MLFLIGLAYIYSKAEDHEDHAITSSNLPLVFIDTKGKTIVDDPKINATMGIIWNGPGKRNALTDPKNDYNGQISIEIRGSTSQLFPKKSYGFETKSIDLDDEDVSLLGLPKENDWVLYASYTDKTMIRDVLTYTLDASMGHYSPRCRYVELFLNNRYVGVYVLMEKIKRNKNRVDIAKLPPTDISGENHTGGYIIKIDKINGSGGEGWSSDYFNNTNHTYYQYDYPKAKEITSEQKAYIQSYVKNMEKALYLEKFTGTGSYHEYLNDTSFIDFMIINELSKNIDGYRLSSYLYKGKNDKMNCGPIWDFNFTYGNCYYYDGESPTGFVYQEDCSGDKWQNPFWWNKLMRDRAFVQKLKKRWSWIRQHEFSNQRITFVTDSLVNLLSEAQVRNYKRWPKVIGYKIGPNYYVGPTYASEVTWMKNWITQRLAYLDKQWYYDPASNENRLASQSDSVNAHIFSLK